MKRAQQGFTLAELSVVLIIVAILGVGAITALRVQNERGRFLEARDQLSEAREALLMYAAIKQHLPCPDTNGDGESDCSSNYPDPCLSPNICALPWKSLGLAERDPWGQTLRYVVSPEIREGAPKPISLITKGALRITNASGTTLAKEEAVAFILWSTGPDARDTTKGPSATNFVAEAPGSDDIVLWESLYVTLGRMLESGWDAPTGN